MMLFKRKKQGRWGFTLIELMVGISIIGMLSSMVLGSVNQARIKAQYARTVVDVRNVLQGLSAFYLDNGFYPACPDGVQFCCVGSETCKVAGIEITTGDVRAIANLFYSYIPESGSAVVTDNNNTTLAAATSLIPAIGQGYDYGENRGIVYYCENTDPGDIRKCDSSEALPTITHPTIEDSAVSYFVDGTPTTPLNPSPSPTPTSEPSPSTSEEPSPTPSCSQNSHCSWGYRCNTSLGCEPVYEGTVCSLDYDQPSQSCGNSSMTCYNSTCVVNVPTPTPSCSQNSDCSWGYRCSVNGDCEYVSEGSSCGPDQYSTPSQSCGNTSLTCYYDPSYYTYGCVSYVPTPTPSPTEEPSPTP